MHYRNGREAKNGDKVVLLPSYGAPKIGILYNAVAGSDTCNGNLAEMRNTDSCLNLSECLHLDDVLAVVCDPAVEVPDSPKAPETATS